MVGLITTDGSLSSDKRHIDFSSKDLDQVENLVKILDLKNRITIKKGSYSSEKAYYRVQFGNVVLYRFLESIGITSNKTKTIGELRIPDDYFFDFLRGHLDGDGYTYSFWDSKWKTSFRLYCAFLSASESHLVWIRDQIKKLLRLEGTVRFKGKSTHELKYAKKSSVTILKSIYYSDDLVCLERKRFKITKALSIICELRNKK